MEKGSAILKIVKEKCDLLKRNAMMILVSIRKTASKVCMMLSMLIVSGKLKMFLMNNGTNVMINGMSDTTKKIAATSF